MRRSCELLELLRRSSMQLGRSSMQLDLVWASFEQLVSIRRSLGGWIVMHAASSRWSRRSFELLDLMRRRSMQLGRSPMQLDMVRASFEQLDVIRCSLAQLFFDSTQLRVAGLELDKERDQCSCIHSYHGYFGPCYV